MDTDTPTRGSEVDILQGYIPRRPASKAINKSERTMARWEAQRIGPPVTYIGKTPYYNIDSLRDWLKSQERKPLDRTRRRRGA